MPDGQDDTVYISESGDPFWNLAFEENLLNSVSVEQRVFLVYVNNRSVVMGRHQNPWQETDVEFLRSENIPLVRRISGGGTVYHDSGNINFSFIAPREGFDRRTNLELVLRALEFIGISAEISESYDLLFQGRKFSGNSFCFRKKMVLHHGTLLVQSNLSELSDSLVGSATPDGTVFIDTHAVRSKPAVTVNLGESFEVTRCGIKQSLLDELARLRWLFVSENVSEATHCSDSVKALYERNRSWEWIYGKTPAFSIGDKEEDWRFHVQHGKVEDFSCSAAGKTFQQTFYGLPFDADLFAQRLKESDCSPEEREKMKRIIGEAFFRN